MNGEWYEGDLLAADYPETKRRNLSNVSGQTGPITKGVKGETMPKMDGKLMQARAPWA